MIMNQKLPHKRMRSWKQALLIAAPIIFNFHIHGGLAMDDDRDSNVSCSGGIIRCKSDMILRAGGTLEIGGSIIMGSNIRLEAPHIIIGDRAEGSAGYIKSNGNLEIGSCSLFADNITIVTNHLSFSEGETIIPKISAEGDVVLYGTHDTNEYKSQSRKKIGFLDKSKSNAWQKQTIKVEKYPTSISSISSTPENGIRQNLTQLMSRTNGWIGELLLNPKVTSELESEAYQNWGYQSQGLTPSTSALIGLAVATATVDAQNNLIHHIPPNNFLNLVYQAYASLTNNEGNTTKVLQDIGTNTHLQSIATEVLSFVEQHAAEEQAGEKGMHGKQEGLLHQIKNRHLSPTQNSPTSIEINNHLKDQGTRTEIVPRILNAALRSEEEGNHKIAHYHYNTLEEEGYW